MILVELVAIFEALVLAALATAAIVIYWTLKDDLPPMALRPPKRESPRF